MAEIKDETFCELREKDRENDFRLDSISSKNDVQGEDLHRQLVKDMEHDIRFAKLEARCSYQEEQVRILISKMEKR